MLLIVALIVGFAGLALTVIGIVETGALDCAAQFMSTCSPDTSNRGLAFLLIVVGVVFMLGGALGTILGIMSIFGNSGDRPMTLDAMMAGNAGRPDPDVVARWWRDCDERADTIFLSRAPGIHCSGDRLTLLALDDGDTPTAIFGRGEQLDQEAIALDERIAFADAQWVVTASDGPLIGVTLTRSDDT